MKVYNAWNKVCSLVFENKEDAEKYAASQGAAVGIQVSEIQVIPSSKQPPNKVDPVCACQTADNNFVCSKCGEKV